MPLVSLTSDYGTKDPFVAALKGQLYHANKDIIIVDINHEIKPFDIIRAAYILKNASNSFPEQSIHIASINIRDGNSRILIVKRKQSFFVVPDNGIISLMFPEEDFQAFAFENLEKDFTFSEYHHALGVICEHISKDDISVIAVPTNSYRVSKNIQAIVMPDLIRGSVIYVDGFGNVVVNIDKEMFNAFVGNEAFIVAIRQYKIRSISKHYSDVQEAEILALFNEVDLLEISMNLGNVAEMLGLQYGSLVTVELAN
jgi:S-adenosylmethionine hydrolase